ncbi:MAG TPA: nitroreductase family protein, partial [Chitinophagaceae bacterium]|nr:nitroreductase family protein [Chitinophagaceae bacterium]
MTSRDVLLEILDVARWAPSGDNTQPWRFEIIDNNHIAIHGYDTRDWCIYDFEGRASYMAHGALLETIRIAAAEYGLKAVWMHRAGTPDTAPIYDIGLESDPTLIQDPLYPF